MKKNLLLVCFLLYSSLSYAVDYQVIFVPASNSVGESQVSTLTANKVSDFSSAVKSEFPPGMVTSFSTSSCPIGWIKADGAAVSRVDKSRLFQSMGVIHGQGDGSTTFNLPDYRGRFLRGVDEIAGRDADKGSRTASNIGGNAGNQVGSVQGFEIKVHTHLQNSHGHRAYRSTYVGGQWAASSNFISLISGDRGSGYATSGTSNYIESTTATNQNSGGTESRPLNAYVTYCVKE